MKTKEIKSALNDLIKRLRDAEKGFAEIEKAVSSRDMKEWMRRYSSERNKMRKELESHTIRLGGNPEDDGSFLGKIHRAFIDIKLNNIENDLDSVIDEIERGESTLLDDYNKVINDVELPAEVSRTVVAQRNQIEAELERFKKVGRDFNSIVN